MIRTILAALIVLSFSPLRGQEGTVVCLHGFFRSYKCMIPMSNTLRSEGLDVVLWDYQSRKKTIEGHAEDLVIILQNIAREKPGQPIHFITHSLGGVITRVAVAHPNCPKEAKMGKAILLAPPNQGSCLARNFQSWKPMRWIFGKHAGRQLLDCSPEEMLDLGKFPSTMEVVVIAGDKGNPLWFTKANDGKVSVHETQLDTPHIHITTPAAHSWIMTSRWTIDFSKDFLIHKYHVDLNNSDSEY
ncbi:MAG: alpha/beta hydrolase [Chlamydiales bacterium]|nr:alpha/beta hydrolase [Chlamydiales bacterium]